MSYADKIFVNMCNDIINNGVSTEGEKVRPKWEDGTPAYTIKSFGVCSRYDLSREFPALTLRKTYIKSALDELLWIWQKKDNNVHNLSSHIWDEWADAEGSIGKAYGYQMAIKYPFRDVTRKGLTEAFPGGEFITVPAREGSQPELTAGLQAGRKEDISSCQLNSAGGSAEHFCSPEGRLIAVLDGAESPFWRLDQVDKVIYDLKLTPFSRRIMTNMYVFSDLSDMNLYPCAYSMTFNVTEGNKGRLILNAVLNQRSQDILAANNWNVCQYSLLLMLLARACDMEAGTLLHVIADAHIYDRHIDIVKELITRKQYPAPTVTLNPAKKDFYDFTKDDIIIDDYEAGEQIKDIPIAV